MLIKYKIFIAVLLAIILSICVKLGLPTPETNRELLNEFWTYKTHDDSKYNIVIAGDSRIYRGVDVKSLVGATSNQELTGVNLGYSSTGYSYSYLQFLKKRLVKEGRRIIVFGVTPHSLTPEAVKNEFFHEQMDKSTFEIYKGLYLAQYLKHFAPYNLKTLRRQLFSSDSSYYHQVYYPTGWTESARTPVDSIKGLGIYERSFKQYQVEDSIVDYFLETIDTLISEGIEIVAFRPPTFDQMSNLEDSAGHFNETYIRESIESKGGIWVSFENNDFDVYDGSHLHYESAIRLSKKLGEAIPK